MLRTNQYCTAHGFVLRCGHALCPGGRETPAGPAAQLLGASKGVLCRVEVLGKPRREDGELSPAMPPAPKECHEQRPARAIGLLLENILRQKAGVFPPAPHQAPQSNCS